jgi:hypothetical protein
MGYLQIVLAALSVAKEFISYLKTKETCKKSRVKTAKTFVTELKKARTDGDTKKLESIFGRDTTNDADK